MKKKDLKKLKSLPYFTKEILRSLNDSSENSLSKNISRWVKDGELVALKNGVYVLGESFKENKKKRGYLEFVANLLRSPSYVSLEYMLNAYTILTEVPYTVTSVTTKVNREYENRLGRFTYRSVSDSIFLGYETRSFEGLDYNVATKAKALFDYLYLKTDSLGDLSGRNMVESLRLDLSSFREEDFNKLREYGDLASKKSTTELINNIIIHASN